MRSRWRRSPVPKAAAWVGWLTWTVALLLAAVMLSGPGVPPQDTPGGAQVPTGEFPDESSTGVPDDVDLTPSGTITVTEDGTVIDGLHVSGRIIIRADNVTVRNTLVESDTSLYPIRVEPDTAGVLIEDVEVDNLNGIGIGIHLSGSGTVRRANVHSAEDGIRIQSSDVIIEDSYVHDLYRVPGGHHDSIQIRRGDDITIRGNNLQAYNASTDDPMNAAIQIGSLLGEDKISDLLVVNNLMNGGTYTVMAGHTGVDSARYAHNRFGRDHRYGAVAHLGPTVTWENTNVYDDNGEPTR